MKEAKRTLEILRENQMGIERGIIDPMHTEDEKYRGRYRQVFGEELKRAISILERLA